MHRPWQKKRERNGGVSGSPVVVGEATSHRFRLLGRPQGDAKSATWTQKKKTISVRNREEEGRKVQPCSPALFGSVVASRLRTKNLLTSQKNLELLVVELHLSLGDEAALCALPHRVHETHAGQLHLLTAALITETPAAPPTVMLQEIGATVRLTAVKRKCLHTHSVCVSHETQLS